MITARTSRKPAATNMPIPMPPALTLTFSSDFASWISFWTRVERSRVASWTSRPMVGSSSPVGAAWTWLFAMRVTLQNPSVGIVVVLVDVGYPVPVVVTRLDLGEATVDPVATAEHDGSEQRGGERADEHTDLHVVVGGAAGAERELPDQQRHGEPDPREHRHPGHVDPAQVLVEVGPGEPGQQPRGPRDAHGLPDDQAGRHAERDGIG